MSLSTPWMVRANKKQMFARARKEERGGHFVNTTREGPHLKSLLVKKSEFGDIVSNMRIFSRSFMFV